MTTQSLHNAKSNSKTIVWNNHLTLDILIELNKYCDILIELNKYLVYYEGQEIQSK